MPLGVAHRCLNSLLGLDSNYSSFVCFLEFQSSMRPAFDSLAQAAQSPYGWGK